MAVLRDNYTLCHDGGKSLVLSQDAVALRYSNPGPAAVADHETVLLVQQRLLSIDLNYV